MITLKGSFGESSKIKISISDLQGISKIQRKTVITNGLLNTSFDVSSLKKGVYFVTLFDGKKYMKQSFVKE